MTTRSIRWSPVVAVLVLFGVLVAPTAAGAAPSPVLAPPPPSPSPEAPGGVDDGDPRLLSEALEGANRAYVQAKAKLEKSQKRQQELGLKVIRAQQEVDRLVPQVEQIAAANYRFGRVGPAAMLLTSNSSDTFVARATGLAELTQLNDQRIAAFNAAKAQALEAKKQSDDEVDEQKRLFALMEKQKAEVMKSVRLLGGNRQMANGFVNAKSPIAKAAPRNPDGSWPYDPANRDDPTTSSRITSRTLNAYLETRRAGFNRFANCFRPGGPYEHPKGRACDWSLINKGFVHAQNKDQIFYGNNLAAFLIRNADRLGIYYVIWYKQIWFPASGWSSYVGPSDHTDHVHMSLL